MPVADRAVMNCVRTHVALIVGYLVSAHATGVAELLGERCLGWLRELIPNSLARSERAKFFAFPFHLLLLKT